MTRARWQALAVCSRTLVGRRGDVAAAVSSGGMYRWGR